MNPRHCILHLRPWLALALALVQPAVHAATVVKANNTDNLNLTTSWTGGVVPGVTDIAQWDATVTAANSTVLGADLSWAGLKIGTATSNPGGLVTLNAGNTLTVGASGIDLSAATRDLTLNCGLTVQGRQSWSAAAGRTLNVAGTFTHTGGVVNFSNFNASAILGTLANDDSGILGPWATRGADNALSYVKSTAGAISAYSGQTVATPADLSNVTDPNVNYSIAFSGTPITNAANASANTLYCTTDGNDRVLNLNGNDLTLNGMLFAGSGWGPLAGTAAGGGRIVIGTNRELVLIVNSGRNPKLYAPIVDNPAGPSSVTIFAPSTEMNFFGVSTYSGGTTMNGAGQLNMNDPAAFGTGPVTFNGGTLAVTLSGKTVATAFTFNGGKFSPGYANTFSGPIYLAVNTTIDFANFCTLSSTGVMSGPGGFTKISGGYLTIQSVNTYSGPTILSAGSIILGAGASLNNTSLISIAGGATFDASAITSYSLGSGTTLSASGAATAATLKGKSGGTVNLGSQPLSLTYTPTVFSGDTARPALTVSQGALTLANNTITVNNAAATPLGAGTYRLIQVGNGTSGVITGTPNPVPVITGTGLAAGTRAALSVSSGNVILTVAPITLLVTGHPSPHTAGAAGGVTVTAKDPGGNTVTGYTGTVHFTSSDPAAFLPGDYTFVAGDNGTHSFPAGVTLRTAGTQTVTATDTVIATITGAQSGITVNPAAATMLGVAGFPNPQATGMAGSVTVTAKDAYGNTVTAYTGTIHFTSSDGAAVLPANYTFVSGDHGSHTFPAGVTLHTVGTQSLTATDLGTLIAGSQSGIDVLPASAAATLWVSGFPSPQTAGVAGSVTVTAKTVGGATATDYTGTIHFTSSDGQAVLPANYTFVSGDNGTHTFTGGVALKTAGNQSVTATDTVTTITGSQSGITVTPAAASALTVSGFPNPQWTGTAGSVTVTARDAYGNTANSYAGTVHFTSSDSAATLPPDYTFVSGDQGTHSFSGGVTLHTPGTHSITAGDGSLTGTQAAITLNAVPTSFTWIAAAAAGNWSDAANWSNNLGLAGAPFAGGRADYTLNFSKSGTYASTNDLGDGFVLNRLNFTNAWWSTWSGNSLVFTANGATLPQLNINNSMTGGISNPLVLAANTAMGGTGGGEFGLSGLISGAGSLTKSGPYQLNLSNAGNNYAGGTTVNSGTIYATTAAALSSGPIMIHGGKLSIGNGAALSNSLTLDGGTLRLDYWNTVSGPVTLTATSTIDTGTGTPTVTGIVSGAFGLISTGNLALNGANTYSGPTVIRQNSLQVASLNRVSGGTPTSNLGAPTTEADGTLAFGTTTSPGSLIYTGPGETTDRVILLAGTTGGATLTQFGTHGVYPAPRGESGLLKFTANVSIPGTAGADNRKTLTLTHATNGTTGATPGSGEISGSIGDSLLGNPGQLATSVTKAGKGIWTLAGANSYSGATRVQAGVLALTRADALGGGPLDISTGAKVQLDFVGTRQIAALTFDAGSARPNGTYGSSASLASYKDDSRFAGIGTVTVGPIASPTTTALARTAGGSPSNGGDALTFTATVAGTAPTGTVVFYDGLTVIGTATLNGSYQASLTTSYLTGGAHAITALYLGAAGNSSSASPPLSQTVAEGRPATATALALTGGSNPSTLGSAVTFTATVTGAAATGEVAFYDGITALGTTAVNGSGQATLTTSGLAVGWRGITARYLGDVSHAPSASSPALFQTVNPPSGNGKVKVFILAGQSNMVGHCSVELGRNPATLTGPLVAGGLGSLRHMLNANPDKYGYLADPAHLNPAGYVGWLKRADVSVAYWGESNVLNRKGILDADFGDNGGLGANGPSYNGAIGPEYGFGLVVGSQLGDPVLLIKYAKGGKSLYGDYRPPSSGGTTGPNYIEMVARVHEVLDNLSTYVDGYAGQGYEIAGFGWHQGWNDSGSDVATYEANLCNLIKDLRVEFNVPAMPVSIGITGMANSACANVIQAQFNVGNPALHPEFAGTVTAVDTRPFDFGELLSPSGDGTHWNWNAESYFNVGESMGLAMMGMISTAGQSPFETWAGDPAQGLTAGVNDGPLDDPDHDGLSNQQEFAFGLNPSNGLSVNPVTLPLDRATARFQYTRRAGSGLTYQVFTTTNLATWAWDSGATEVAVTTSGEVETVTVQVSTAPLAGKLFVRVQAQ